MPEPVWTVPGWIDFGGRRMFVVDLTSAGFPIGYLEDDASGDFTEG